MPNRPFIDEESERNFQNLAAAVREGRSTVFVGAGLSQQANLPGWRGLLEGLCSAAKVAPIPFRPGRAARDIETIRAKLGNQYLPTLRKLLAPRELQLSAGYRTIADTPFKRFATINVDELLYYTAFLLGHDGAHSIYEYPSTEYLNEPIYYLHGRLHSAKTGDDLVLCDSDYHRAYGEHGETRQVLTNLFATSDPVLFVGSSLYDPDLMHLLTELRRHRRSSSQVGGRRLDRYAADPKWFAILPADLERLVRQPEVVRYVPTTEIPRLVRSAADDLRPIHSIWYEYDPAHRGLYELLERLRELTRAPLSGGGHRFLADAENIERLAAAVSPTRDEVDRALLFMRLPAHRRHFFRHASSSWLAVLWNRGGLAVFDEPSQGADGDHYVTGWDAAEYFVRSASTDPQVALDVILTVKTENWLVNWSLARALGQLPANSLTKAMPAVREWLNSRFAGASPVAFSLLELLQRLVAEQEWDAAINLFELMAEWKDSDE